MAAATLNTRQLMEAFGVGHMTIYNWRHGTPTKEELPFHQDGRNVSFKIGEVKAWARKHGVSFAKDPSKIGDAVKSKPGPKALKARKSRTSNGH